ncbi:MAG: hypothetical protein EOP53_01705 [Sphingobacteriales bacterium]|nr:MAG: hypothetical protein EOP53_01705 [Sphingobacteriales bacterium]
MPKFATETVSLIKARENVEQLIIDGRKVLDEYMASLKGTTYESELGNIIKYIEHASNGNSLPKTKMRKYQGNKDGVTEYEYKSKHLRVWAIQQPNKKIIIFGGFKNNQAKDESSFRNLKKQFLESLK